MNTIFRVRELRRTAGMTQMQLARRLDLKSASAVTMWESGARNPSSVMLLRLAEIFHCTIDELYGQHDEHQKPEEYEKHEQYERVSEGGGEIQNLRA